MMHQKMYMKALALYLLALVAMNLSEMKADSGGGSIFFPINGSDITCVGNPTNNSYNDPYEKPCVDDACTSRQDCEYTVDYAGRGSYDGKLVKDSITLALTGGTIVSPQPAYGASMDDIKLVFFPWLGYGHAKSFMDLAIKLTTRRPNFKVYMCSSHAMLNSIEHKITERIKLVPILFQDFPDLPHKLHTTNGLPPNLMPLLKEAMQSPLTIGGLSDALSDIKPHLIIYDILQPWIPALARKHKIPSVEFVTSGPTSISIMIHYFMNPTYRLEYPFPEIYSTSGLNSEEIDKLSAAANNQREKELMFKGLQESSDIVLVKGCREIESKYIDYASGLLGKKFVSVGGPLIQTLEPDEEYDRDLLAWLDTRDPKSTVFVSFGSEYFLSEADLDGVALGLELSGVNFIWIVRFPKNEGSLDKSLPEGFLERVGSRGRVLKGWAPQAKILGHESTGGFVSHCGWNSVLESMSYGVPIIGLPMHLDQPTNARLIENAGVGVEVERDKNGSLRGDRLAAVIKEVVVEDGGEKVRNKAAATRDKLISKGDEEIDQVWEELMSLIVMDSKGPSVENITGSGKGSGGVASSKAKDADLISFGSVLSYFGYNWICILLCLTYITCKIHINKIMSYISSN